MNLYNLIFWMVFLILLVRYINKTATDGGGGAVDGRHSDDCKRNIGPGLKSPPVSFVSYCNYGFCTNSLIYIPIRISRQIFHYVRRDPKILRRVSQILIKEGLHFADLFYFGVEAHVNRSKIDLI